MTGAVLDLKQGSTDWLLWRQKGIGSSDAAAILDRNPWMTKRQLWELKTGRAEPQPTNEAMFRGNDLEPLARELFEAEFGKFPATCMVHPSFQFLKASLDGWDGNKVLEIKCPSPRTHAIAKDGYVPDHYVPQLQHLLMVSGAPSAYYVSYDGKDIEILEYSCPTADLDWLLAQELDFWDHVLTDVPPPNPEDM